MIEPEELKSKLMKTERRSAIKKILASTTALVGLGPMAIVANRLKEVLQKAVR